MKGLKIEINKFQLKTGSKWIDYILLFLLFLIGLILLPLLVLLWIFGFIFNLLTSKKIIEDENKWNQIDTRTNHLISFKWVNIDELPDYVHKYFDNNPLIKFKAKPKLDFFEGFFTDFKIERDDGLFIQKVILNDEKRKIEALPIYFFNYSTLKYKEIIDLKGYEIESKGKPNDFIISAFNEKEELQITLTKE